MCFFFFKQKTEYDMRISDWSSDVCSSDLVPHELSVVAGPASGTLIGDDGGIDLAGAVARIVGIEVSGERRIIGGPVLHSVILQTECHERAMRKRQAPSVRGRSLETEREGPEIGRDNV